MNATYLKDHLRIPIQVQLVSSAVGSLTLRGGNRENAPCHVSAQATMEPPPAKAGADAPGAGDVPKAGLPKGGEQNELAKPPPAGRGRAPTDTHKAAPKVAAPKQGTPAAAAAYATQSAVSQVLMDPPPPEPVIEVACTYSPAQDIPGGVASAAQSDIGVADWLKSPKARLTKIQFLIVTIIICFN